jgi:hypothetical protein
MAEVNVMREIIPVPPYKKPVYLLLFIDIIK